jgi:predicted CXXCH cytochrome family protein
MIASLLLSACLHAAPTPAATAAPQPKAAPAASTAPAAQATAPKGAPAATQAAPKAATPATAEAPTGLVVVETKRGKLEFSHKAHAKTGCAECHQGQAAPARFGLKGSEAAHKYCVDCHKASKKGPEKCSWCHKRE